MVIDPTPQESAHQLPRLVIAAPGSGHGKTTVATGLMGALAATGRKVAGFKIGPDYIDPGYHTLATGRLGRRAPGPRRARAAPPAGDRKSVV